NQALDRQRKKAEENERTAIDAVKRFRDAWSAVGDYLTKVSQEKLLDVPGMQPLRKELVGTALAYYRKFIAQHAEDPGYRSRLADAHERLGMITDLIGTKPDALADHRAALDLRGALARESPDVPEYQQGLAKSHNNIGLLLK